MKSGMIKQIVLLTFIATTSLSSQAALLFSTDLATWQSQLGMLGGQIDQRLFVTNHTNVSKTVAGGITQLPAPGGPSYEAARLDWNHAGNNVDLGRTAAFKTTDTNFNWGFEISAVETDNVTTSSTHDHGTQHNVGDTVEAHVFFNDRINRNNFDQVNAFTDVLSIGKFRGFDTDEVADGDPYNWDNDDFSIKITSGPSLYALAFEIVNNKKYIDGSINPDSPQNSDGGLYSYGRESITVTDIDGQSHQITESTGGLPVIPGYYNDPNTPEDEGRYTDNFDDVQFIGIVSDTPFTFLEFNEDSRTDDIGIKNLRFATVAAVPVPAAIWMLGSGLLVLSVSRRKKMI